MERQDPLQRQHDDDDDDSDEDDDDYVPSDVEDDDDVDHDVTNRGHEELKPASALGQSKHGTDDDVWASFLKDVSGEEGVVQKEEDNSSKFEGASKDVSPSFEKEEKAADDEEVKAMASTSTEEKSKEEEKKPFVEVFDFAGEEVRVERAQGERNGAKKRENLARVKRPLVTSVGPKSSLTSLLSTLEKKPKISTLEKSRLDWDSFKESEHLGEDLERHNRGKGGFLAKQEFLEKADHRQFEHEKKARLRNARKN